MRKNSDSLKGLHLLINKNNTEISKMPGLDHVLHKFCESLPLLLRNLICNKMQIETDIKSGLYLSQGHTQYVQNNLNNKSAIKLNKVKDNTKDNIKDNINNIKHASNIESVHNKESNNLQNHAECSIDFNDDTSQYIIFVLNNKDLANNLIMRIQRDLMYSIIELLLGGVNLKKSIRVEGRKITDIELGIMQNICSMIFSKLAEEFNISDFYIDRIEYMMKYAITVEQDELIHICKILIDIDDNRGGHIELIIPNAALKPIRRVLNKSFFDIASKVKDEDNAIWADYFIDIIKNLKLKVEVAINNTSSTINELFQLKIGNTVLIERFLNDEVEVKINQTLVCKGKLGTVGKNVAVQLNGNIDSSIGKVL